MTVYFLEPPPVEIPNFVPFFLNNTRLENVEVDLSNRFNYGRKRVSLGNLTDFENDAFEVEFYALPFFM